MTLSFQWKIRIVLCLLSVSLTSLGVYCFYFMTYQMTMDLLRKNLRDVGNTGAMLFDHEDREAMKRLKAAALQASIFDRQVVEALPQGGTFKSIPPERVKELHASKDFQMILHRLKMINHASYKEASPLLKEYEIEEVSGLEKGMMAAYLMIGAMDSLPEDICMYLASSGPEPTIDGWPGNPIGNLFRAFNPWSRISQKIFIGNELITDDFYQSLSGTIPILDETHTPIALLGMDYSVGRELNKLNHLKWICFALIAGSFLLALLLSFFISRVLNAPLGLLHRAAINVSQNNYTAMVDIKSADEFGLLGKVFNQMLANIRRSFRSLEMKNRQLASVVGDMHDGVGSILTSIAMISQANHTTDVREKLEPINRLSQQGLSEVRFLMDALEYEKCDLSKIAEEVEMLAADILKPMGISLTLARLDTLSRQPIDFNVFLELHRVFREAFTNIIKHSNAVNCKVDIELSDSDCHIRIQDNGNCFADESAGLGRGLKSIAIRIQRIGGTLEYGHKNGFQINITLPTEVLHKTSVSSTH